MALAQGDLQCAARTLDLAMTARTTESRDYFLRFAISEVSRAMELLQEPMQPNEGP